MNSKYLKTTHITVGGLNDGKTENQHNLDPMEVANAIKWILESRVSIPIIGIEKL
jgi:NADP-dependent 3-hydroxy acid dehydrogenase YdfG